MLGLRLHPGPTAVPEEMSYAMTQPIKNPFQPIVFDAAGVERFKSNMIVSDLLAFCSARGLDLNAIAARPEYTDEDRTQFSQLIGYSVSGFAELPHVTDEDWEAAQRQNAHESSERSRADRMREMVEALRRDLRVPIARLYGKHTDDLCDE